MLQSDRESREARTMMVFDLVAVVVVVCPANVDRVAGWRFRGAFASSHSPLPEALTSHTHRR